MSWTNGQTLHIFVNNETSPDNWVEEVLGHIVKPLWDKFGNQIEWLWVTRYIGQYNKSEPPVNEILTEEFLLGSTYYRFVAFRLSADEKVEQGILQMGLDLVQKAGFYASKWIDYDVVNDLGSNRFIFADATNDMRSERAKLILSFMDATVKLILNSLVEIESGNWRLEPNISGENPNHSFFESVHHLFCNATKVPINVIVGRQGNRVGVGTNWMSLLNSVEILENDNQTYLVPLQY